MIGALALLATLAGGALIALALWPPAAGWGAAHAVRAALAGGIALGLCGLSLFLAFAFFDARTVGVAVLDVSLLGIGVSLWARARRRRGVVIIPMPEPSAPSTHPALRPALWAVLGLVAAGSLLGFVGESRVEPHGGWDAWAVWNLRGRALAGAQAQWTRAFDPAVQHPEYPLLLPGVVARVWRATGTRTTVVPIAIAACFAIATVVLASAATSLLRSPTQGLLVAIAALPPVAREAAKQYADVPIAFFLLAAHVCLLARQPYAAAATRLAALGGICVGLAAWTKDEGVLFVVALAAAEIVQAWRSGAARPLASFAIGALPGLLACLYFKSALAPPSELFAGQSLGDLLAKLGDPERYLAVGSALAGDATRLVSLSYWAALIYVLLATFRPVGWRARLPVAVSLTVIACGLLVVYVTTPYDQAWHLSNSLDRLLVQLLPTVLLVSFTGAATPVPPSSGAFWSRPAPGPG